MFDANMRYLNKDYKFFAKVHQCNEGTMAYDNGIRKGDLIICKMLDQCNEDPSVEFHHNGVYIIFTSHTDFYDFWAVYEGNIDGKTDFICDKSRRRATQILRNN